MKSKQQWIKQLQQGDSAGLKPLMDLYGNEVLRTAALLMSDRHLAEDISQEVFLTAYRKIGQLHQNGSLRGWLLKITVNICRTKMRRASWKRLIFRDLTDHELISQRQAPESAATKLSLASYLDQMPYKYREAVVLHYYQDMAISNMAELLSESEGTVKSKLSRGRRLLKTMLEKGGWNDEQD